MKKLLMMVLINIISIYLASQIISSVKVESTYLLIIAGVVLALVNILIRPWLIIIALPVNIVSLGLFTLVINTWMVMLTSWFIGGLSIPGFWPSMGVAVIIILVSQIFRRVVPSEYYRTGY